MGLLFHNLDVVTRPSWLPENVHFFLNIVWESARMVFDDVVFNMAHFWYNVSGKPTQKNNIVSGQELFHISSIEIIATYFGKWTIFRYYYNEYTDMCIIIKKYQE